MTEGQRPTSTALGLYAVAFLLLVAAGVALGIAVLDELQETRALWVSVGLSYAAAILALVSLLVPGRATR